MKKKILVFIFGILLLAGSAAHSMTRSEIRDMIRLKARDAGPTSAQYYWSDTRLNNYINLVQRNLCRDTSCLVYRYYITTVEDQATYTLIETTNTVRPIKILRAYIETTTNNEYSKLTRTLYSSLEKDDDTWENTGSSVPTEWYIFNVSTYTTSELRIGIEPKPSSSYAGTDKLRVDVSYLAVDMDSDSDIPFDGNANLYGFHETIVYGVCILCMQDMQDVNMRDYFQALYDRELKKMYDYLIDDPAKEGSNIVPAMPDR